MLLPGDGFLSRSAIQRAPSRRHPLSPATHALPSRPSSHAGPSRPHNYPSHSSRGRPSSLQLWSPWLRADMALAEQQKASPSRPAGHRHLQRPVQNAGAHSHRRMRLRFEPGSEMWGRVQKVASEIAKLRGIKRGRSQMVSGAILDMCDALQYMKGGKSGRGVLLKALQLIAQ